MNVLVIGAGAIGCFYGALLARASVSVTLLARSGYDHLQAHGVEIESGTELGNWRFTPDKVIRQASELTQKPDYVLLCVKVVPDADRIALLRDVLGPDTSIVLVCNGVEIEEEIARAFPNHELVSALAFICVTRKAPGHIWHQAYGRIILGNYPSGSSAKTKALADRFRNAGIAAEHGEDVVSARWQKCLWNASFSSLSVLSGGLCTNDILDGQEGLVRTIMSEVSAIAAATGHPVPPSVIDGQIESTRRMPPYKTSMLLDFEQGRPMETEALLGNVVRAGRREGVDIPHLETLYALMKLRELQLARDRQYA